MKYSDRVINMLARIRATQKRPGGTGAPEGYCEMHEYHVWEVLNAVKSEPLPTEDDYIITSAEFGQSVLVRVTYNRDPDGVWVDDDDYTNFTLHGPFVDGDEAQLWIDAYPDGDRDLKDIDTIPLNNVRPQEV